MIQTAMVAMREAAGDAETAMMAAREVVKRVDEATEAAEVAKIPHLLDMAEDALETSDFILTASLQPILNGFVAPNLERQPHNGEDGSYCREPSHDRGSHRSYGG